MAQLFVIINKYRLDGMVNACINPILGYFSSREKAMDYFYKHAQDKGWKAATYYDEGYVVREMIIDDNDHGQGKANDIPISI